MNRQMKAFQLQQRIKELEAEARLEDNYDKIIAEVIECHPIPACKRTEDKTEPPWEVVKRIRLKNEKLEARLANAEAHAQDFKDECDEKDKVIDCIVNTALQAIVKVREKEREACAKIADKYKDIDYAASQCGTSWPNTANEVATAIRKRKDR